MQHLSESERAYRRGCLQAVQYALSHNLNLAELCQILVSSRTSNNPKFLGTYMDAVLREMRRTSPSRCFHCGHVFDCTDEADERITTTSATEVLILCRSCYDKAGNTVR